MSQRDPQIDTLRGLACLLLVTYHVLGANEQTGLRIPDGDPLRLFNDSLVYVRMPLFSFLSGFVYAWRPFDGDAKRFVTGKVKRLLIPMLLVGTFFAVLQANTPGTNATGYDWQLLHIIPVSHFWFLESLFLIFIGVAVLERLQWLQREDRFAVVWAASVAMYLWNPLPVYFGMLGAVLLMPSFLLGVWCNRFGGKYRDRPALLAAAAVGLSAVAFAMLVGQGFPDRNSGIGLMLGVASCIFLHRLRVQAHWLAWIGVHSFGIYLFHTVFSAASRIMLYKIGSILIPLLLFVGILAGLFGPIALETALKRHFPWLGSWVLGESLKVRKNTSK